MSSGRRGFPAGHCFFHTFEAIARLRCMTTIDCIVRHDNSTGRCSRSRRAGYTVIELLIVLMIAGIVMTIALPAMFATIRGTRLEAARQEFIGDLRLARMEAIRRNVSIAVEKTSSTTYTIDSIGTRTLADGATFTSGPTTLRFAAFGPVPTGATTYTMQLNGKSGTVRVSTAGNATAQ